MADMFVGREACWEIESVECADLWYSVLINVDFFFLSSTKLS